MAGLGFEALTTTSAGLAFVLGKSDGDGSVTRDEALANAKAIVDATDLPVAGDLENGYGDSPEAAAETIRMAGEVAGLVGASIEDRRRMPFPMPRRTISWSVSEKSAARLYHPDKAVQRNGWEKL